MEKSNKCFETNPDAWRAVKGYGLQLLLRCKLERYCDKFPDKKDLQDEWKMAVTHPGKYINLLVGQLDNKDLSAERDEENHYDSEPWDRATKSSWPTIRSRHKRVGMCQGPMKRSTIRGSR
jgi:hypothetical protein